MKTLVVLSLCVMYAMAAPGGIIAPAPIAGYYAHAAPVAVAVAAPVPVAAATQYHAQDELGQYNYGYANPDSYKAETRAFDGTVNGRYGYISPEGNKIELSYTAGAEIGFNAAGGHLPVPPAPTPEVAAAAADHENAKVKAAAEAAAAPEVVAVAAPAPVAPLPLTYAAAPIAYAPHSYAYAAPHAYNVAYAAPIAYAHKPSGFSYHTSSNPYWAGHPSAAYTWSSVH